MATFFLLASSRVQGQLGCLLSMMTMELFATSNIILVNTDERLILTRRW
jgi:hypothetical protein